MKDLILILFCLAPFVVLGQWSEVNTGVYEWDKLPVREGNMRMGRKLLEGSFDHLAYLEIHATTQAKGAKPAPPHTQEEIEEILIVKEGLMKMTMNGESRILGEGSVICIPPLVEQSLENVGDGPLTYYVMMYKSKKPMDVERGRANQSMKFVDTKELSNVKNAKGSRTNYFDQPTTVCEKLELHVTQLDQKGPSHAPHQHVDSEIILIIEGESSLFLDGKNIKAKAGDLYLIASNQSHGISNISDKPCKYFAIRWY